MRARRAIAAAVGLLLASAGPSAVRPADAGEAGPAEHYRLHCAGCHGAQGRGVPGTTPSLDQMGRLLAAPGGRAYLGRVPGVAQAPIGDAELAALLNWALLEFSGVSPVPPYTSAETRRLRADPLRDPDAARPAPLPPRGRADASG